MMTISETKMSMEKSSSIRIAFMNQTKLNSSKTCSMSKTSSIVIQVLILAAGNGAFEEDLFEHLAVAEEWCAPRKRNNTLTASDGSVARLILQIKNMRGTSLKVSSKTTLRSSHSKLLLEWFSTTSQMIIQPTRAPDFWEVKSAETLSVESMIKSVQWCTFTSKKNRSISRSSEDPLCVMKPYWLQCSQQSDKQEEQRVVGAWLAWTCSSIQDSIWVDYDSGLLDDSGISKPLCREVFDHQHGLL